MQIFSQRTPGMQLHYIQGGCSPDSTAQILALTLAVTLNTQADDKIGISTAEMLPAFIQNKPLPTAKTILPPFPTPHLYGACCVYGVT